MEMYHTPGPWKAIQAYGYKIRAADGKIVASLPTHCPLTWESPANAYLIAAAPDLFAACRLALDVLKAHSNIPEHIKQALHDAIAEAVGQSVEGWMPAGDNEHIFGLTNS